MARNVLFITADQWRADAGGFASHPTVKTPHLDALAAEGAVFERHYTCATPCGPARATLHTGLYPFTHRSVRNGIPLDDRFTNIAREVRAAGFDPVLFGYTDTSLDPRGRPTDDPATRTYEGVLDGFRLLASLNEDFIPGWLSALARRGYEVPASLHETWRHVNQPAEMARFSRAPARYRAEDSDTAYIADKAVEYLKAMAGRGWFAHVSFLRPHPPLIAPAPYNEMYDARDTGLPVRRATREAEGAQHPFLAWWHDSADNHVYFESQVNTMRLDDDDVAAMRAVYFGLLTEVDHHIGRLLATVRECGDWDDTLIVVTGDHGEMLGDHWIWGKGGYFDGSNHVPLIIRDPRLAEARRAGVRVDAFTESVDVAPTILEWLGLDVPHMWDGRRLNRLLDGSAPEIWRDGVFWSFDFRDPVTRKAQHALGLGDDACVLDVWRTETSKYVHFAALPPLLFDLAADPGEFYDLAADPRQAGAVAAAAQRLLSHRMVHAERTLTAHMLTADGVMVDRTPRY